MNSYTKSKELWKEINDSERRKAPGKEWGNSHLQDDVQILEKHK